MVQIKSGGEVYSLGTGKQLEWHELPQWIKDEILLQEKAPQNCVKEREALQQCIMEDGFWQEDCVNLLAVYDKCQISRQ